MLFFGNDPSFTAAEVLSPDALKFKKNLLPFAQAADSDPSAPQCDRTPCARSGCDHQLALQRALSVVKQAFDLAQMDYWLTGHTLLSAARHGSGSYLKDGMPLEVGFVVPGGPKAFDAAQTKLQTAFAELGVSVMKKKEKYRLLLGPDASRSNVADTLLIGNREDTSAEMFISRAEGLKNYIEPKSWIFPLGLCRFYNMHAACPRFAAKLLISYNHGQLYADNGLHGFTGKWRKKDGVYDVHCLLTHECPLVPATATSPSSQESVFESVSVLADHGYVSLKPLLKSWRESGMKECAGEIIQIGQSETRKPSVHHILPVKPGIEKDEFSMFDGHCQAGPCARINQCDGLKVILNDLHAIFASLKLQWWLYGGALIGAGRHGTLESDDDMDIAVLVEGDRMNEWPRIEKQLEKAFADKGHTQRTKTEMVKYFVHPNGYHTDLHVYFYDSATDALILQDTDHVPYIEPAKWIFPIKKCRVYDLWAPCPNQAAKYMYTLHASEYAGCCILVAATGEMGSFTIKPCANKPDYWNGVVAQQTRLHNYGYASFFPLIDSFKQRHYKDCEQELPDIPTM